MDEYEAYQTARVEGFIPADQSFEEYLLAIVKQVQELAREATDPNGHGGKGGDTMRKIARIVGVIE